MFGKKEEVKLTLEEKVDLLLKYQKQARFWAAIRGIMSFLVFMIFIVLPIVATVYIWDDIMAYMQGAIDQYQHAMDGLQTVNGATDGAEKTINEMMNMLKQYQ